MPTTTPSTSLILLLAAQLLVMQFPHYSLEHLRGMLATNAGDLPLTIDILYQLESELEGSAPWLQWQGHQERDGEEKAPAEAPPVIDDEATFPNLGTGTATPPPHSPVLILKPRQSQPLSLPALPFFALEPTRFLCSVPCPSALIPSLQPLVHSDP